MDVPNTFGKILLVEDNPGDVRLTKEMLKEAGLEPTFHVVNDGSSAIDFSHQRGEYCDAPRPDAIFLDLYLGKMNGDEVLSEIADDIDDIPVIVLSGSHGMRTVQFEDIADEVTASIEKPIDPEEVRSLVQLIDKE